MWISVLILPIVTILMVVNYIFATDPGMPTEGISSVTSLSVVCSESMGRTQVTSGYFPFALVGRQCVKCPMQDALTNEKLKSWFDFTSSHDPQGGKCDNGTL